MFQKIFFYQNLSLHQANVTFRPDRRSSRSWSCCRKWGSSSAAPSFQSKIKPSVPRSAWDGDGLLPPTPRWCLTNCASSGVRWPIKLLSRYDADINDCCCCRGYCLAWLWSARVWTKKRSWVASTKPPMPINSVRRRLTTDFAARLLPSADKGCAAAIDSKRTRSDISCGLAAVTHCSRFERRGRNYIIYRKNKLFSALRSFYAHDDRLCTLRETSDWENIFFFKQKFFLHEKKMATVHHWGYFYK